MTTENMSEMVEYIAKALSDNPDDVKVSTKEDDNQIIISLELNEDDKQKIRPSNKRRMTNLGIFRHYIIKYLQQHENISNDPDYISIVGENEPTEKGVGISILAYYNATDTLGFKNTVADIFDHLFAVIHEFELDFFQLPSDHMQDSTADRRFVIQD